MTTLQRVDDPTRAPRLELRGIRKTYPTVEANAGIDLAVMPAEIHAVLGENGAGKSTLMKVIYGVVKPDDGEVLWEGRPVVVASPAHARRLGIGMVFQHFSLFETLSVAENVALAIPGSSDLADLSRRITTVSERYGLPINPRRLVHTLSVGERQRVEIIRCLLQEPRLLIMDEPTSVLPPQAVEKLFETLRRLAAEGCSILYISHKLDEIQALCHRATVLRAGKVSGVCDPREESSSSLAHMMIGRDLPAARHPEPREGSAPRLVIAGLSRAADDPFGTDLQEIDLAVHSGEIVGIAGVSGNGQQELAAVLTGEQLLADPGQLVIDGVAAGRLGPLGRRRLGYYAVPEERLGRGAVPAMSLTENALLTTQCLEVVRGGLIQFGRVKAFAERCIADFDIRCGGSRSKAVSLSGGNLQKFIVAREMLQGPKVLVVSQPTWGLDVGAAAFIRQSLVDLRNEGTAILVISEEIEELFEICDRIAVIANGRMSPCVRTAETDAEEIGLWMTGLWPSAGDGAARSTAGAARNAAEA